MKTTFLRASTVALLGSFAVLAGCASAPTRHNTNPFTPAFAASNAADFVAPVPLERVAPYYPVAMRRAGITGTVILRCTIDPNGRVQDAKAIDSPTSEFNEPAIAALRQWRFKPALQDGVAVATEVHVPILFELKDGL